MTATELRSDLLQQIEQADEKLLRIVSSVLEAVKVEYVAEEEIIGYRAGEEMTVAALKTSIAKAENQIDQGEFLTADELEKETDQWLSSIE